MRHLTALGAALIVCAAAVAEPPMVTSFRAQKNGDTVFFTVKFAAPPHVAGEPPPRLVPQDEAARTVVHLGRNELSFAGKWSPTAETASFRLLYAVQAPGRNLVTVEAPILLNRSDANPDNGDLKKLWAGGQMAEFARWQKQTPDFNFYPLARLMLARKYGMPLLKDLTDTQPTKEAAHRLMFETHTGGAAVAESLQIHRLLA